MESVSLWEGIFMLVLLKIPMVYLAAVVWWAIRAEPLPGDGDEPVRAFVPLTPCDWKDSHRRRPTLRPAGPRGRRTRAPRARAAA